ncbi:uncharacterized protein C8orf88 isoform X1 [Fundulus heteroclitus]|uniref:uncharacterized protein C8orf88 isoform X1 n=1 Tax=Fundulus heteroclitus TaxID=8078 RepID=UPI00165C567D|nr:uncharacterized protein C8orf88 isoform X1 [Fundulus heteroclitus]XP_035989035.1 uncharacterized protein C8orf88 isoform X1 [Fundulus heteroclitus]XP_035989037.1 uncharacterized protein C8orf88 isoform X1 [Fundulus heteroclitus]XP_035989038.1 uncharacterized protein C8orf88 isoform X1 [Fundulus heteroclitus]
MEVSRRRVLLRHLEPARPLRRCVHADVESPISAAAGDQDPVEQETTVGIEQVFKIFNLHKQKKVERISYTREVLIGLASCPEAKKRPEYLPDHPIVLPEARDPGQELRVTLWNGVKEDV